MDDLAETLFEHFIYLMVGKRKHWEEIEPGVWQVKDCYSTDLNNKTRITIKIEGENYVG